MKKAAILAATLLLLVAFLGSCIRYSPMKQVWTPKSYKKQPNRTPSAYKR
jgi:hypothetical protein